MEKLLDELTRRDLGWVHDVWVQIGQINDPGVTVFFKLIVILSDAKDERPRDPDHVLSITLPREDEGDLNKIKDALLNNPSLKHAHDYIRNHGWYRATAEVFP
ncbi:hypothetical protein [Pseudomonas sp. TTU2014-080ASC]|uniref:hypothetical protein n=1 Tax=Pseudomonas sp. TTU2014-080ASC TaxID=1729724 RepID=UPI0007188C4C|nr:hypothetical protein [Pseudomonas sp. TTU2014-080ASC]